MTQELLKELFDYREDGFLLPKNKLHIKMKPLGSSLYRRIIIFRKTYFLHRMIFLYHHGQLPKTLDHIDRDRANNRIENLRSATHAQNSYNKDTPKHNTTGMKGVRLQKRTGKYEAAIMVGRKQLYLGTFLKKEDAAKAYDAFAKQHFGEFACTNF